MTGTFHIKNFDRLQHYKDRSPPWIKLYNGLLDDYDFGRLPDATKAHLIAIGLLASRHNNKLPLDADWLGKRINATQAVDLDGLIKSGFVVPDQDCSNAIAECLQDAMPEREGETQVETETETPSLRSGAPKKRKSRRSLPENFPEASDLAWAKDYWLKRGRADLCTLIGEEIEKFRDHHAGKLTASADWPASWRTWARNAIKFNNGGHNGRANGQKSRGPTALDKSLSALASLHSRHGASDAGCREESEEAEGRRDY
jgi:hypothetical protein